VEENTAAAQSMLEQAKSLEKLISFFKVEDNAESEQLVIKNPDLKPIVKQAVKKPSQNGKHQNVAIAPKPVTNNSLHTDGWEEF